jgi:acylglycerol lipase
MTSTDYTESWLQGPSSTQFYTRTWSTQPTDTPKAIVVFVHGFAEHIARYELIFPMYAKKGITVFAYDQRGFGRTAVGQDGKGQDYGRTSWDHQFTDMEWALNHAKESYSSSGNVPLFLMGHSMVCFSFKAVLLDTYPQLSHQGGGLTLGLSTRHPQREILKLLSGVIASSPLILQTKPAAKPLLWLGSLAGRVLPGKLIPAPLDVNQLSHDAECNKRYAEDPLIRSEGSLRGIGDMLTGGIKMLAHDYQHWPSALPVLFMHGDADQIASCAATQSFFEKIPAQDKKIHIFPVRLSLLCLSIFIIILY